MRCKIYRASISLQQSQLLEFLRLFVEWLYYEAQPQVKSASPFSNRNSSTTCVLKTSWNLRWRREQRVEPQPLVTTRAQVSSCAGQQVQAENMQSWRLHRRGNANQRTVHGYYRRQTPTKGQQNKRAKNNYKKASWAHVNIDYGFALLCSVCAYQRARCLRSGPH